MVNSVKTKPKTTGVDLGSRKKESVEFASYSLPCYAEDAGLRSTRIVWYGSYIESVAPI